MDEKVLDAAKELAHHATVDTTQERQSIKDIETRITKSQAAKAAILANANPLNSTMKTLAARVQELQDIYHRIDLLDEATKQVNQSVINVTEAVTRAETYMRRAEAQDVVPVEFTPPTIYQTENLKFK